MERVTLQEIFSKADGFRRVGSADAGVFTAAESVEAALLCESSNEILAVERLSRVQLAPGHVAITTHKGDCYYFGYERIVGLRVIPTEDAKRERGAGFR